MKHTVNPFRKENKALQKKVEKASRESLEERLLHGEGTLTEMIKTQKHARAEIRMWESRIQRLLEDQRKAQRLNDTKRVALFEKEIEIVLDNLEEVRLMERHYKKIIESWLRRE